MSLRSSMQLYCWELRIGAFAIKAIRGATVDVATFRKRAGYSDPAFVSAVAQAPVNGLERL